MIIAGGATEQRHPLGEVVLWAGAAIVVLALHLAAVAWLMRAPPPIPAETSPPPAIMIDLAEMPEAVQTEETEISPDRETAEASASAETMETPDEAPPEEVADVEPVPVPPEPTERASVAGAPVPDDPTEQVALPLDHAEVPIPTFRPAPPKPKKQAVKKREPRKPPVKRRQPRNAAAKQATEAQARAAPSRRNAARQNASGLLSSVTPARWQSRLMAHLERRKRYPAGARSRRQEGTAYVRFRIDDAGNVLSVSLARSSGFPILDDAVLSLVRRASPVPAPPPGVDRTITAPVRFSVR
ncbi:energy transducer TonB family protein [Jiella pacifica]|uniref:TonB family protein n=1 Tax=Jiella pacifica TaxID=2696469 RepID=A0A6N9T831_9HYPH|nr:TonB family protein [Jiella pacifica]NDW07587.1 TonB family protein [Jiella pacifica]